MIKSKIIFFTGIFACGFAYADTTDYLDSQLVELTARRDKLKTELAECEKNTRGFKIAGISTLAATGAGVYANVALAKEIKRVETFGASGSRGGRGGAGDGEPGKDPCLTDAEGICQAERECAQNPNYTTDPVFTFPTPEQCVNGCGKDYPEVNCCAAYDCECFTKAECREKYSWYKE